MNSLKRSWFFCFRIHLLDDPIELKELVTWL